MHVAGALTLDDAARIICLRSQVVRPAIGQGAMLAVSWGIEEARRAIEGLEDRVSVAVSNSPTFTVLSGDTETLERKAQEWSDRGVYCRRVKVSYASHSPQMDRFRDAMLSAFSGIRPRASDIPIYSTLLGRRIDGSGCDEHYWCANLREPVLFGSTLRTLADDGFRAFVEQSPHPLLLTPVEEMLEGRRGCVAVGSLVRDESETRKLRESAARLWSIGADVHWPQPPHQHVVLPTYPWQRKRYWVEEVETVPPPRPRIHPLLGYPVPVAVEGKVFENRLGPTQPAFLGEHRVGGLVVVPATALLEMARHAGETCLEAVGACEHLVIERPAIVPEGGTLLVQTIVRPDDDGLDITICSLDEDDPEQGWQTHARTRFAASSRTYDDRGHTVEAPGAIEFPIDAFDPAKIGLDYGPSFRGLRQLRVDRVGARAVAHVVTPGLAETGPYAIHPAVLDACWQASIGLAESGSGAYLPIALDRIQYCKRAGNEVTAKLHLVHAEPGSGLLRLDIDVFDPQGQVVCRIEGLTLRRTDVSSLGRNAARERVKRWLYDVAYVQAPPATLPSPAPLGGEWLVVGPSPDIVSVAAALRAAGGVTHTLGDEASNPAAIEAACGAAKNLTGVVLLPPAGDDPIGWNDQPRIYGNALQLLQAVAALEIAPRIWMFGCVSESTPDASPWASTRAALAAVAQSEYPSLRVTYVEIDERHLLEERLLETLRSADDETRIRYRQGVREVARLVRSVLDFERPEADLIRSDGTYIVTGGLGALGWEIATWLAERGAGDILLLGRSDLDERRALQLERLRATGARCRYAALDVSDATQVEQLFDELALVGASVRGIVHAAGVLDDATIPNQTWATFERVMRPKVLGAWNLHLASRRCPLDFFVMFSSAAALFGSPGQANYAAANMFLDELARLRRRSGLPGLSIGWGAWRDTGLAAERGEQERALRKRAGLDDLTSADGLMAFEVLLQSQTSYAAAIPVDWEVVARSLAGTAPPPLFSDWITAVPDPGEAEPLAGMLRTMPSADRLAACSKHIGAKAKAILGWASSDDLAANRTLLQLGMDSLMAMRLRNELMRDFGIQLPTAVVFERPTVAGLATFVNDVLEDELLKQQLRPSAAHDSTSAPSFEEFEL